MRSAVAVPVHFFVITGDSWYALVVLGTAARHPCDLVRVRNRYGQTSSTSPDKEACRGIFAFMHCKSLVNGFELVEDNRIPAGVHCVDLGKCGDTHGSLQRHTLGGTAQSSFRGSHKASWRLHCYRRAIQHGGLHTILRRLRARRWCRIRAKVSFSRSPTAPSVQSEMRYPWDRCGVGLESTKVSYFKPLGVSRVLLKIQYWLQKLRNTSDVKFVKRKESEIRRAFS